MVTVLREMRHTEILAGFPRLTAYQQRGEARPAFVRALADQAADPRVGGEARREEEGRIANTVDDAATDPGAAGLAQVVNIPVLRDEPAGDFDATRAVAAASSSPCRFITPRIVRVVISLAMKLGQSAATTRPR